MIDWYINLLVKCPRKIIATIVLLYITIIAFPFLMGYSFQFSDPQLGFETRGTIIGNRQVTWDNLIRVLERGTELIDDITRIPAKFLPKYYKDIEEQRNDVEFQFGNTKKDTKNASNINTSVSNTTEVDDEVYDEIEMTSGSNKKGNKNKSDFFCSKPTYEHARVVFTIKGKENLLSYQAIKDMCLIQERLENLAEYKDVCDKQDNSCCPPWSLVNYITLLRKHTSCSKIIPKDINATQTILEGCAHYYHDNQLLEWESNYRTIPPQCIKFKAVYNLMHYHLDVNFMAPHASTKVLSSSLMFLPFGKGSIVHLYEAMKNANLSTSLVKISAIDFGIKEKLFDFQLINDIYLIFLSVFFIMFSVFIYTWSLTISLVTLLNITFSLFLSYFIYTYIFGIYFFPFMNVLAIIVLIGISADSSFIMCDVWKSIKVNNVTDSLDAAISKTLKHSLLSISLSTTITFFAFLSSYFSSINGISCFSIFSSLAVLGNLIITTTLLPACIILLNSEYKHFTVFNVESMNQLLSKEYSLEWIQTSFKIFILKVVFNFRWVWVIFFTILGLVSAITILIWPVMKLPDSLELQLFRESHPFEQYDLVYKNQFWFERILGADNNPENLLPLRFVWGILPNDTGSHFDPKDHGNLIYDPNFDIAHPKSQSWLLQFCKDLRTQHFYQPVGGPHLTNCFLETFISWMDQNCSGNVEPDRWPCCNSFQFPYSRNVFHFCIMKAMAAIYNTPRSLFIPTSAGPKFSNPMYRMSNQAHFPIIKAVVVEFESNYTFSTSYVNMKRFYNKVESWSAKIMDTAPPGLRNGWFYSHLGFYDLQRVLIDDTIITTIISLVFAFILLLIVTKSVLLTTLTTISIFFIICTTIAVLVLMDWHLNVLESISISVAIGLSIDFSVHYSIEYQLACEYSLKAMAVAKALYLMASPSLMGAITTGATGAFMLPSDVLPYTQLGIFLIIIMFVSWLYSTFYLVALLSFVGPEFNHGPYAYRCCKQLRNISMENKHVRRPICAVPFPNMASALPLSCLANPVNPLSVIEMETLTVRTSSDPISVIGNSQFYVKLDDYDRDEGNDEINNHI